MSIARREPQVTMERSEAVSPTMTSTNHQMDEGTTAEGRIGGSLVAPVGSLADTGQRVKRIAPDVVGLDVLDANSLIKGSGLTSAVTLWETKIGPWGMVLSQYPEAGERVRPGSRVDVVVAGRPHLMVPDVRGQVAHAALESLRRAGLRTVTSEWRGSGTVAPGHVISSRPKAGSLVVDGEPVSIAISRAPARQRAPGDTPRRQTG